MKRKTLYEYERSFFLDLELDLVSSLTHNRKENTAVNGRSPANAYSLSVSIIISFWTKIAATSLRQLFLLGLITVNQSQKSIHTIVANMAQLFSYTACRQLSPMFLAVIFFHGSEYILAVGFHGKSNVTLKSLLISKNYLLAIVLSLVEYCVEIILFPGLKEHWWVSNLGLAMVIIGEIIRKMAIITAGKSFTHIIRTHPSEHHRLITNGVYRVVRHPGYCGFFIWSVGTQIMLCNPVSTIAFALVVWRFFAQRIPYEEYFLRQFFGPQYEEYGRQIPSGVPFVK